MITIGTKVQYRPYPKEVGEVVALRVGQLHTFNFGVRWVTGGPTAYYSEHELVPYTPEPEVVKA